MGAPLFAPPFALRFRSVGAAASVMASASEDIHARAAKLDALGSDAAAGGTFAPRSLRPGLGAPPPPPSHALPCRG